MGIGGVVGHAQRHSRVSGMKKGPPLGDPFSSRGVSPVNQDKNLSWLRQPEQPEQQPEQQQQRQQPEQLRQQQLRLQRQQRR